MAQLITQSLSRRLRILSLAAAAVVSAGWVETATAVSRTWGGLQLSPNYSNPFNWTPIGINPFDSVNFTNPLMIYRSILIDGAVEAQSIFVANTEWTFYSDGTRSITTANMLGVDSTATLNFSSVTVNVGSLQSFGTVNINNGGTLNLTSNSGTLGLTGISEVLSGRLVLNPGGSLKFNPSHTLSITKSDFGPPAGRLILNTPWQAPAGTLIKVDKGAKIMSDTYFDVINSDLTADGAGTEVSVGNNGVPGSFWSDFGSSASGTATANVSFSNGAFGLYYFGVRMANTGGKAVLTIQNSAKLEVRRELVVGGSGTATVNLNSGGYLDLGLASGTFESGSTFNFSAGLFEIGFGQQVTFNTGSTWNWSGGDFGTFYREQPFNIHGGIVNNTQVSSSFSLQRKLNITNAGKFLATNKFDLGTCTVLVDGAGSRLTSGTTASDWANATVTLSNGGAGTYSAGLNLGSGSGTVNFSINSGATFTAGSFLTTGGAAALITLNNGVLASTGTANFRAGSRVNLTSGGLLLGGDSTFSSGSTLNFSGGSLAPGSGATLTFDGGVASVSTNYALPAGATLRIANNGRFDSNTYVDIANGAATGTLLVDGFGSRFTTAGAIASDWGRSAGNSATVAFSNQSIGTFSGLRISNAGGTTRFDLNSDAQLNVATLETGSTGATVTINIAGGALNNSGTALYANGTNLSLSSGTMNLGTNTVVSAGATLNWSGGKFNFGSGRSLILDGGSVIATDAGLALNGSTLTINAGGLYDAARFLDIGSSGTGTLLVSGANARISSGAESYWGDGVGHTAIARFSNGGVATFSGGVQIGRTGAQASVEVQSGGQLYLGSMILGSPGVSNQALLNIIGAVRIANGAQIGTRGVVLFQAGTFEVGGALDMSQNANVYVSPGGNKVLRSGGLSMTDASKIDLTDNDMIIDHTGVSPIEVIKGYIIAGHNGGAWNGNRIATSAGDGLVHGLGYGENSILGFTTFDGNTVDSTTLLVKYTYYGDGNLDGKVDIRDLYALASNWNATSTFWTSGDFNYDGATNAFDLAILARNWQVGTDAPSAISLGTALEITGLPMLSVPEPGMLALLGATILGIRRRR